MSSSRTLLRAAGTLGAALALTAGALASATSAQAATVNPYSPAYQHSYRHGAFPTEGAHGQMQAWAASHKVSPAASTANLNYGGGVDGIGVTTGAEKVYVVFWGSQWGTSSTNSSGYMTLSGDPQGMAPRLQAMFKGLGTNSELWSGVMTQYCEGVATGSQTCPSTSTHVAYPATSGALAGVWEDTSVSAPSQATGNQIGTEAVKAAGHFGNTTSSSNRNAQYFIVSPTGTHPDGFNTATGNFCAWHDWNGDSAVNATSSYGDIAFTNAPYVTDAGTSCGMNYVNSGSAGTLDGVTMVMGHEYAETITDQNPAGGWTDSSGSENADKCAWNGVGGSTGSQNVSFATGSFAMQATWGNDGSAGAGACQISHAIVTNGGGGGGGGGCTAGQLLGNPGFETGSASPWSASAGVINSSTSEPAHSGSWDAWMDGYGSTHTDTLSQSVSVPTGCTTYTFSFYLHIDTSETTTTTAYDKLTVKAGSTTLATYSNLNHNSGYALHSFNLSGFAGQTVSISFTGTEDSSLQTSFVVDDTAVNVS